jgi:hypothetical protein
VYFVDELFDDSLLLIKKPSQFFHLFSFGLDIELVCLLLHQGMSTLFSRALLGPQPLLPPVTLEHAFLEERLFCSVFYHLSAFAVKVRRHSVITSPDLKGAPGLPVSSVIL